MRDFVPNLAAMLDEVVHDDPDSTLGWCDDQTEFEFGLDILLDGIARRTRVGPLAVDYSPDELRRWPDIEAADLPATDAADRLILDESAAARGDCPDGGLVVIGDAYGALTLGAVADGARGVRVHQDPLTGERALAANAGLFDLSGTFTSLPLRADSVAGARVVLVRLPRSLDALADIAGVIAAHAHPDVVVFAGGRIKHMTLG